MPRVKAGIDRTGVPETSHAQGSADEEHCACSDFTDDEQAAQSGLAQTGWLSRPRAAPNAEGPPFSRFRPVARESRKLAPFALAIRKTNPNSAMSNAVNALT